MSQQFSIPISSVVEVLGLAVNPKDSTGASSYNVKCPFCDRPDDNRYHMNINQVKNVYFCPRCMDASTGNSGALDLYGRVRHGTPIIPGRNGKSLFHELMCELEKGANNTQHSRAPAKIPEEIRPASNIVLNKAYCTLLALPYLALTKAHGRNLLERGLDRKAILEHGYASLVSAETLLHSVPDAEEAVSWYEQNNIGAYTRQNKLLRRYKKAEIIAGLIIARDITNQCIPLDKVPGFFKLKGRWCFRYDQGMLIPTRDAKDNIICLQVRRDVRTKEGLRYMTVSSKGLPEGVTCNIARTHFARRGDINSSTTVIVTEGPLKADVICHLLSVHYTGNLVVVALQGINNTRDLPSIAKNLHRLGIKKVFSALDMDKTANLHVAQAGRTIRKIFRSEGIEARTLCWDREYAIVKREELSVLCREHNLATSETKNPFTDIYSMACLLSENEIPYSGKWGPKKGLDDLLNSKFNSNRGEAE